MAFESTYRPDEVERTWAARWEEARAFHADETSGAEPYCIVIPPPNVTGILHVGHALNDTLQDILVRWRRMQGRNTLWVPGTDHAGIATQNVVEKQLAAEGKDRHALGREEFVRRVWRWKEESGGRIIEQLKRLGCSCDWERQRFTLDEGLSRAVLQVFVTLHAEGLIYRDERIINWCPRCHTALSDLEVEYETKAAHLYHVRYPLADGEGGVTVATTRPETIPGDTAVAVNPDDPRYAALVGRLLRLPAGPERTVPVVADAAVDREFGTGALKITPAHDASDFETGRRHGLEAPRIMDESGRMTEAAGPYAGLDRFAARKRILADLEERGLLVRVEDYGVPLGHCYRCKTVVEPALSPQWFVRARPLAEPAIAAVREGRTRIIPEHWERTYFEWMENIRDWCISRQIWWGHQIPAWYCLDCNGERVRETTRSAAPGAAPERALRIAVDAEPIVAAVAPERCPRCGGGRLVRDPDVLDTWFSSALWPFSTLGWPERTRLLETFYPTSALVTSFDILFFWVARMMMMGIRFMGDVPFRDVYIHALVRDAEGQKMSKSRGNVIDPIGMMERYGTDAVRFTLTALAAQGRDIKLAEERIAGYRNFVTKLWNASRLVAMNLEGRPAPAAPALPAAAVEDRWILSRLEGLVRRVNAALEGYVYNEAASALYQFTWHEFCDWYLEIVKPRLAADDASGDAARAAAVHVLRRVLALLHPIMPFVTEEIAHRLPGGGATLLATAAYPAADDRRADERAERELGIVVEVVEAVRNIRGEMNIRPGVEVEIVLADVPAEAAALIADAAPVIRRLAKARTLAVNEGGGGRESATAALGCGVLHVPLAGAVDLDAELKRLDKEIGKVEADIGFIEKKLSREDFVRSAPPQVVEKDRRRLEEARDKRALLAGSRERVAALRGGRG